MPQWITVQTPIAGTFDAELTDVIISDDTVLWRLMLLDGSGWSFTHHTALSGPRVIQSEEMCRALGVPLKFQKSDVVGKKVHLVLNKSQFVTKVRAMDPE